MAKKIPKAKGFSYLEAATSWDGNEEEYENRIGPKEKAYRNREKKNRVYNNK